MPRKGRSQQHVRDRPVGARCAVHADAGRGRQRQPARPGHAINAPFSLTLTGTHAAAAALRPDHVRADARRRCAPRAPPDVAPPVVELERLGRAGTRRHAARAGDRQEQPNGPRRPAPSRHRPGHGPAAARPVGELDRRRDARRPAARTGRHLDRDAPDPDDHRRRARIHADGAPAQRGARGGANRAPGHGHRPRPRSPPTTARSATARRSGTGRRVTRGRRSWPSSRAAAAFVAPDPQKTTVVLPWRSTRSSQCACTARASTVRSTSAPMCASAATSSRWLTRITSCSMIGPASSSSVT